MFQMEYQGLDYSILLHVNNNIELNFDVYFAS